MWHVWGRKKKFIHGFREGTLKERNHLEWLGVYGRMIPYEDVSKRSGMAGRQLEWSGSRQDK